MRSDFLRFVSWLAGWVVTIFSCSVVCRFAYIMTAVVVVSCFSVFGVCCFVYTMTTVSVVLVFPFSVFAFLVMTMTFVVRPLGIFALWRLALLGR